MKKRICMLILAVCMTAAVTGCSSEKKETSESTKKGAEEGADIAEALDITKDSRIVTVSAKDMGKYVKLGDYKGIAVEKSVEEVTDDVVQAQIDNMLSSNAVESEDPEAQIKEGDIANIDFKGTKDGEAFEGGSGESYDLTIGSGSFIEGFEEGLIGAKKGETRELPLTFPENYTEDLAGKEVVFTVTVNSIKVLPELSDDWVKENTEYDTLDAYEKGIRAEIKSSNEQAAESTAMNTAWNTALENCEIKEYPKEDLDAAVAEFEESLQTYADQQKMTTDEFLEAQGMTKEDMKTQGKEYAEYKVKQSLVAQAIMDAEGINLTDKKSEEAVAELVQNFGATDISKLVEQYGSDAVIQSVALSRASSFVLENAKVTSSVGTEDGKAGFDADAAEEASGEEEQAEEDSTN